MAHYIARLNNKKRITGKLRFRTKLSHRYHAQLKYRKVVVLDFETDSRLHAMAKLSGAISDSYPYARGEVKDNITGLVIYSCCQTAIC